MIDNIKNGNEYYKSNFDLFFKGTKRRLEFNSNDTLFENKNFKRLTVYTKNGGLEYDSLIINNELFITQRLNKIDSMEIVQQFRNNNLYKVDTFIFNKYHDLLEYRTESLRTNYKYNEKGLLVLKTEITPSSRIEKNIQYFSDSIIIIQTKVNKYSLETYEWFYYFNKNTQIERDSTYTLKQSYSPPNFDTFHRSDTSVLTTIYGYDGNQSHISTKMEKTKHEIIYKKKKPCREITNSNGKLFETIEYEYLSENLLKKKYYRDTDTVPHEVKIIKYKDKQIVNYLSINNTFQFEQRNIINLDLRGRILTTCKIVSGDTEFNSTDCKLIEYTDY
ncbi:MAG: hypothetical protein HPY60_10730 [Candidatus Methanofastidiosum sp.]|nr:hypothetical protein [Methanofastidiosum sp.]